MMSTSHLNLDIEDASKQNGAAVFFIFYNFILDAIAIALVFSFNCCCAVGHNLIPNVKKFGTVILASQCLQLVLRLQIICAFTQQVNFSSNEVMNVTKYQKGPPLLLVPTPPLWCMLLYLPCQSSPSYSSWILFLTYCNAYYDLWHKCKLQLYSMHCYVPLTTETDMADKKWMSISQ